MIRFRKILAITILLLAFTGGIILSLGTVYFCLTNLDNLFVQVTLGIAGFYLVVGSIHWALDEL